MSTFAPTHSTLHPNDQPDQLSEAVVHSLSRPISGEFAWGPLKTFILGTITLGLWPLISWPRQFGKVVVSEQRQLWHLAEWLRVRGGDADAQQVRDSIRSTGAPITLGAIPLLLVLLLLAQLIPMLARGAGFPLLLPQIEILNGSFPGNLIDARGFFQFAMPVHFYKTWNALLCIGFISHWLHVRHHASAMKALVGRLNPLLAKHQLPAVATSYLGIGLHPMWILLGAIGAWFGAWWAIPAVLAGSLQQRYIRQTTSHTRAQFSQRVHSLLLDHRPPLNVPTPFRMRQVCPNQYCGGTLPNGAKFCPRCGTKIA